MKQSISTPTGVPTAHVCINKSRLKVYKNEDSLPIFYLQKGQEFSLELFNPTTDTLLARIELNGTSIAQGGLVLRPGERVFLERYIDVAKKFKFDTYEVNNTEEVKKAIADNGDLNVQFFKESKPTQTYNQNWLTLGGNNYNSYNSNYYSSNTPSNMLRGSVGTGTISTNGLNLTSGNISGYATNMTYTSNASLGVTNTDEAPSRTKSFSRKTKTIETGMVEMGSESGQKLEHVNKTFDSWPMWTVGYKLLPISQKVNTSEDLQVKRYCTSCGAKQKAEFKFCPTCGTKA